MKQFFLQNILVSTFAVILCLFGTTVSAAQNDQYKVADGMAIYLGVIPAEMIQGHPVQHPESGMHGGIPAGEHRYHIVVALFDNVTGKRITDVKIKAIVAEIGLAGQQKELEHMLIANTTTFGNYFNMPGTNPYRIQVEIQRLGTPHTVKVEFEYRHSRP